MSQKAIATLVRRTCLEAEFPSHVRSSELCCRNVTGDVRTCTLSKHLMREGCEWSIEGEDDLRLRLKGECSSVNSKSG